MLGEEEQKRPCECGRGDNHITKDPQSAWGRSQLGFFTTLCARESLFAQWLNRGVSGAALPLNLVRFGSCGPEVSLPPQNSESVVSEGFPTWAASHFSWSSRGEAESSTVFEGSFFLPQLYFLLYELGSQTDLLLLQDFLRLNGLGSFSPKGTKSLNMCWQGRALTFGSYAQPWTKHCDTEQESSAWPHIVISPPIEDCQIKYRIPSYISVSDKQWTIF